MTTLRAKTVFADDKFTVTAIESLEFQTDKANRWGYVTASLKPVAVVVKEADKTCAFDMDAQPIDIDRLELPADFRLA